MSWDTVWNQDTLAGDWSFADNGDFQAVDRLGTAVVLCLFTNKPRPENTPNRQSRKWHGDMFDVDSAAGEEGLGSLLWTLEREALNERTAQLAEHYVKESLLHLVRHGFVVEEKDLNTGEVIKRSELRGFDIETEVDKLNGRLSIRVVALGEIEREFKFTLFPGI